MHGTRLKIAIASPPADGRANAALLAFVADRLGLPVSRVTLLSGTTAREKRVAVEADLEPAAVAAALAPDRRA